MRTVRTLLWTSVALVCVLTFVWPALAPESRESTAYQVAAIAAMWLFIAALAALLWEKACKAPRT